MAALSFNLFLLSCFTTFALLCFTTTALTTTPTITKPRRYVTKLIHPGSVHSPFYNPTSTVSDRARRVIDSSSARLAYLQAKFQEISLATGTGTDDVRAGVIAETTAESFIANISIGEPPSPQLLVIDTGSSLSWTQCQPCSSWFKSCFQQAVPVFDPSKSSTYKRVSNCSSPTCDTAPGKGCDASGYCTFNLTYNDGTTVTGPLATETLTFVTSDEGTISVPNIIFGCANSVRGFGGQASGLVGLGSSQISLVSQLGSKFSYCFGRVMDPQYIHNQLVIGDGAKVEGLSTPLEILGGSYFLTLQSISVGETNLNISPSVFQRPPNRIGGVVIDSGTTLTYLPRAAFDPLNVEVRRLADGLLPGLGGSSTSAPCYKGVIDRDLIGFPVVTFHFANGVDLDLDMESLFFQIDPNKFCMAVAPSDVLVDLTLIGVLAQQNYNIAYDLVGKTLSVQRIDCELLES
jgi:hypothetical protein